MLDDDDARVKNFELKGIAETKIQEAEELEDEDEREAALEKVQATFVQDAERGKERWGATRLELKRCSDESAYAGSEHAMALRLHLESKAKLQMAHQRRDQFGADQVRTTAEWEATPSMPPEISSPQATRGQATRGRGGRAAVFQ